MAWTLGGVTIHPSDEDDIETVESHYAVQDVVDAVVSTLTFYGAASPHRSLKFTLFENSNGGTGRTTLKNALKTDASVNLTSDQGSQGNYKLMSLEFRRKQALNMSLPVYMVSAELIEG